MTKPIDEKQLEAMRNGQDMPPLYEIIDTLSLALKVVRAAQMLESHNAFCEGTRSYDAIHSSVHARMKDVREALAPFSQGGKESK